MWASEDANGRELKEVMKLVWAGRREKYGNKRTWGAGVANRSGSLGSSRAWCNEELLTLPLRDLHVSHAAQTSVLERTASGAAVLRKGHPGLRTK